MATNTVRSSSRMFTHPNVYLKNRRAPPENGVHRKFSIDLQSCFVTFAESSTISTHTRRVASCFFSLLPPRPLNTNLFAPEHSRLPLKQWSLPNRRRQPATRPIARTARKSPCKQLKRRRMPNLVILNGRYVFHLAVFPIRAHPRVLKPFLEPV